MKSNLIPLDVNIVNVENLNEEDINSLELCNIVIELQGEKFFICRHLYGKFNKFGLQGEIKVDHSSYIVENKKVVLYLLLQAINVKNGMLTLPTFKRIEVHVASYFTWIKHNKKKVGNSIESSKETLYDYLNEQREKYNKGQVKNKPTANIRTIVDMLGVIYKTDVFHSITFDSNNEDYSYFHTNELTIEECVKREKNNVLIPLHNLILNVNGKRIFIFRLIYPDYIVIAKRFKIFVNLKSCVSYNTNFAKYTYEEIIKRWNNGYSSSSIDAFFRLTIDILLWTNKNGFKFNNSIDNAKKIFTAYTLFLKQAYREGKYKNPQAQQQHEAYKMLKSVYKDKNNDIRGDMNLISSTFGGETTKKSSDEEKEYHYSFYVKFFNKVTDFILNEEAYPLRLDLIKNSYWCLPNRTNRYIEIGQDNALQAFDTNIGTIKKTEDLMKEYKLNRQQAQKQVNNLCRVFKQNNTKYSKNRLELAKLAQRAFYMLFLTNTAMNDSNASTLLWNNEYETKKDKVKFTSIKYRAKGKTVEFQIQSKFLILFNKYLRLREYLLEGNHSDHLFFEGYQDKTHLSQDQIIGTYSSRINQKFSKTFDENLPRLTSRKLRVNKIVKAIEKKGLIAAADIGQNTLSTVMKYYQGEGQESTGIQLTEYFEKLNSSLFNEDDRVEDTSIGGCASKIEQRDTDNHQENFKDCRKQESCLFCEDYRLHADKEDFQKVYSLSYIINESKYIAKSESHFISIYGDILKRIENIENQVIEDQRITSFDLQSIKNEVFENQVLHPYWENKLEMLLDIGVLI